MGVKVSLDMSGLKSLKKNLNKLGSSTVSWGFFGGHHSEADMSYAALAWLLEEGTRSSNHGYAIPPRPAFKQMLSELRTNHKGYEYDTAYAYKGFLEGATDYKVILTASGEYLSGYHQDTMYNWVTDGLNAQHNSPVTVGLKGFDRPFVETGELIQNVAYRIN